MMPDVEPGSSQQKKRVLIVGAGAAGMSCADTLIQHPDKFDVTLVEAQDYCGGQMFSIPVDKEKHGAGWLNQGVQGGSHIYKHTFHMFGKLGYKPYPVNLQVSFGKDETFWTNVFPTTLIVKHSKEIKRFSWVIKLMRWFQLLFAVIPIRITLKMFWFSDDFINCMIYPSLALFLGTGNATPHLPSILMVHLYTSPTYGMWYPPDPNSLTSNLPPMVVFPEASKVYGDWKHTLEKKGVKIRLATEVARVIERKDGKRSGWLPWGKKEKGGVKVAVRKTRGKGGESELQSEDEGTVDEHQEETIEEYDELVFCVLADTAKRILGSQARWIEKKVLGATEWSDDVTITHTDLDYMKKWYELEFREDLAVRELPGRKDESARVERALKKASKDGDGFKPMYLIKQTPSSPRKLEMSFDCTAFQHQFPDDLPLDKRVFQTIFLNKKDKDEWSLNEIDKSKIIKTSWWHQLCHSYTHYIFVVPLLFLLQKAGRKTHTTYAGSWTMVNAHEAAVISGVAAGWVLGADYPLDVKDRLEGEGEKEEDRKFARLCFRLYLLLIHWRWYTG